MYFNLSLPSFPFFTDKVNVKLVSDLRMQNLKDRVFDGKYHDRCTLRCVITCVKKIESKFGCSLSVCLGVRCRNLQNGLQEWRCGTNIGNRRGDLLLCLTQTHQKLELNIESVFNVRNTV
jgi:hypothetical protein